MWFSNLPLKWLGRYQEEQSPILLKERKTHHNYDYEFLPPDVPYIVCLLSHEQQQYV